MLDIPGSTVIITGNQDQLNDVPVRAIRIWIKDGRSVSGGPFERIIIHPKKPLEGFSLTNVTGTKTKRAAKNRFSPEILTASIVADAWSRLDQEAGGSGRLKTTSRWS